MNVAILGASEKKERLSNMAQVRLKALGHRIFPVTPVSQSVLGVEAYKNLQDIQEPIHTLTVYLAPDKLLPILNQIIKLNPERVILNPGTEDDHIISELKKHGIPVLEACTLVMMSSSSF